MDTNDKSIPNSIPRGCFEIPNEILPAPRGDSDASFFNKQWLSAVKALALSVTRRRGFCFPPSQFVYTKTACCIFFLCYNEAVTTETTAFRKKVTL